jgi:hypothetical protein
MWMAIVLLGVLATSEPVKADPSHPELVRLVSLTGLVGAAAAILAPDRYLTDRVALAGLVAMSLQIGLLSYATGALAGDMTLLYTFVVVLAAYFLRARYVLALLGLIVVLLVARELSIGLHALPADEILRVALLVPGMFVIAWLVSFLRRCVDERESRLRRIEKITSLVADPAESPGAEAPSSAHASPLQAGLRADLPAAGR